MPDTRVLQHDGENPPPDGENSVGDFVDRFWALQEEAKGWGVRTLVVVLADDPIDDAESKAINWCGCGPLIASGMAAWADCHLRAQLLD